MVCNLHPANTVPRLQAKRGLHGRLAKTVSPGVRNFLKKYPELFWLELEIFFQSPATQPHSQDVHLKGLVPTREVLVDLEFDRVSSDHRRSCHRR